MANTVAATEIVASLEGMKVVIRREHCELHEYNFDENSWHELESSTLPMAQEEAQRWLKGWNSVDRLAALNRLVEPQLQ